MNKMSLNEATLETIIHTYTKMNELKCLLSTPPFLEIKKLLESGDELNKMLNEVTKENSIIGFRSKLEAIHVYSSELSTFSQHFETNDVLSKIDDVLIQISTSVAEIKNSLTI